MDKTQDKLKELLEKNCKITKVIKEYAALIAAQYTSDPAEADKMWELIILKYGERDYYNSVLRIKNEIAAIAGMKVANTLVTSKIDRVQKLLLATKGSKPYKIYELCATLIADEKYEKAVQILMCLDNGEAFYDQVEYVIKHLQENVEVSEHYDNSSTMNQQNSPEISLNRSQLSLFLKTCSAQFADLKLKESANNWYILIAGEDVTEEEENEIELSFPSIRNMFPDVDPDLAEIVLEVADECYRETSTGTWVTFGFNFDTSFYYDELLRRHLKEYVPNISDEEIELQVFKARKKREQEAAENKVKLEKKKASIKEIINSDSQIGWQLAFQLCGDVDTKTTRKVRYNLRNRIPEMTLGQKIEICEKYVGDNVYADKQYSFVASDVYREIIEMILTEGDTSDRESIDKYFVLSCQYAEDKNTVIKKLIDFCSTKCSVQETNRWRRQLLESSLADPTLKINPRYLLRSEVVFENPEQLANIINKMDYSENSITDFIYMLIQKGFFDLAEEMIDKLDTLKSEKTNSNGTRAYWIESIRYRMKYYRQGYTFPYFWNPIRFHDYLQSSEVSYVADLKARYAEAFKLHRQHLTVKELLKSLPANKRQAVYSEYIETCKKEILLIPDLLTFIDEFRSFANDNSTLMRKIQNTQEVLTVDRYSLIDCSAFKDLAIYYEREKQYAEAIRVCDMAIACGYENDGTKMGMTGRREKLRKKI